MKCQNCGSQNKIKLNDKHYCADCGNRLEASASTVKSVVAHKHKATAGQVSAKPEPAKTKHVLDLSRHPAKTHQPPAAKPKTKAHHSAQTIHGVRKQPRVAQTADISDKPHVNVQHKPAQRARRAHQTSKNPNIRKFSPSLHSALVAAESPEPVPEPVTLNPHATYMVNKKAAAADAAATMAMHHQRFAQPQAADPAAAPIKTKKRKTRNPLGGITKLFKSNPRLAMTTSVALSVLVLAGYISYLNYPNLSLRIAASRAGVDASLPNYTPSGYSFNGPVEYGHGQVTVRFSSNSDAGFFNLSQAKTDWDSSSLLENHVLPRSKNYLTFQAQGLNIYMYSGNNAAWVNQGTFYSIEGNNYLNSDQIIKMATSL